MPDNKKSHPNHIATQWFVRLSSDEVKSSDFEKWQEWVKQSPDNESAWQKVEQVTTQFKSFSTEKNLIGTLRRLYDKPKSDSRRNLLKQMAVLLAVSSTSYMAYKKQPWQEYIADYSTATGERREVALEDGTQLYLNTATAVDVDFDDATRTLTLLKGEVLIETGHENRAAFRPFTLKTQHGSVTALGTRFSVRDSDSFSSVSVFEGSVRVKPKLDSHTMVINAGESLTFNVLTLLEKGIADPASIAWTQGFLIVDQMTLGEFVTELSRYRSGLVQCDPRIAHLRISGSFPTDTDAALNILSHKLPVQVQTFTRYWTKLIPI